MLGGYGPATHQPASRNLFNSLGASEAALAKSASAFSCSPRSAYQRPRSIQGSGFSPASSIDRVQSASAEKPASIIQASSIGGLSSCGGSNRSFTTSASGSNNTRYSRHWWSLPAIVNTTRLSSPYSADFVAQ